MFFRRFRGVTLRHSFTSEVVPLPGARGAYWLGDSGDRRDHLLSSVHLILGTSECEKRNRFEVCCWEVVGEKTCYDMFFCNCFFFGDEIDFRIS